MGFFAKFGNWIRGRGWKEIELEVPLPPKEDMERAEDLQYKKVEPQKIPEGERVVAEVEERKDEKKIQPRGIEVKETEEMKEAVKKIETAPKTKEIEKGIKPEGQNKVKVTQTNLGTLNDLKPQYTQIFTENAKISDPDIMEVLYRGRAQLQHRFTAQITVMIDGKLANTLEVVGTLIEHTSLTYNFVNIGMQIDSPPQLDALLTELGSAYESHYGAISSSLKGTNMHKGKVTNIEIDVTFA